MRCDRCQFWETDESKKAGEFVTGLCNRAMPFWEATEWDWQHDIGRRKIKPEFADRRFFAQDGSDYNAVVYTTPDFFCADFKEVTPTQK